MARLLIRGNPSRTFQRSARDYGGGGPGPAVAGELGVPLGLGAAVCWGLGDFLAKGALGRLGLFRTIALVNIVGFVSSVLLVLLLPLLVPGSSDLPPGALPTLIGVGLASFASQGTFYLAFRDGLVSVISPLTSVYPAVTILLALLFLGEDPGLLRLVGAAIAISGIALLSAGLSSHRASRDGPAALAGVPTALVAMVAIGSVLFLVKEATAQGVGAAVPLLFIRGFGAAGYAPLALAREGGLLRNPRPPAIVLPIGLVDTLAFLLYNFGVTVGYVAVVSPLSGMYSVITVFLAVLYLGERPSRAQVWALLPLFLGVILLSLPGG